MFERRVLAGESDGRGKWVVKSAKIHPRNVWNCQTFLLKNKKQAKGLIDKTKATGPGQSFSLETRGVNSLAQKHRVPSCETLYSTILEDRFLLQLLRCYFYVFYIKLLHICWNYFSLKPLTIYSHSDENLNKNYLPIHQDCFRFIYGTAQTSFWEQELKIHYSFY